MKPVHRVFAAALFAAGAITITSQAAVAGYRWDAGCRCHRPDSYYSTRRVVREPAEVRVHPRYVDHTRVVYRPHVVQENRTIVHVRPVIDREVVVHRENTVVQDVNLYRLRTQHVWANDYRREVVQEAAPGYVVNAPAVAYRGGCNCGGRGLFASRYGHSSAGYAVQSYGDDADYGYGPTD